MRKLCLLILFLALPFLVYSQPADVRVFSVSDESTTVWNPWQLSSSTWVLTNDGDGSASFQISAVDIPIVDTEGYYAATEVETALEEAREYTDSVVGIGLNYWLQGSNVLGNVYAKDVQERTEALNADPDTLSNIYYKSTVANTPTPFVISDGVDLFVHFQAKVSATSVGKTVTIQVELWRTDSDGSTTPIQIGAISSVSEELTTSKAFYRCFIPVATETIVPAGKRLWLKFIADPSLPTPTYAPTVSIWDGDIHDHFVIPVSGSILGRFIRADGVVPMTADWEMGNYDLTLKAITGDGTIEGATMIQGGQTMYDANDEPGGELGGTFASFTIDDGIAVSNWNLTTPTITSGAQFADADITPNAAGELVYDNTVTGLEDGGFQWYDDDGVRQIVDIDSSEGAYASGDDTHVVTYNWNGGNGFFDLQAGGGAIAYDDIGDPDAASSISFGNDEAVTWSSAEDTGTAFTIDLTDGDLGGETVGIDIKHAADGSNLITYIRCYDNSGNDLVFDLGANGNVELGALTARTLSNIIGGLQLGTATSVAGNLTMYDEGLLTLYEDGDNFSVTMDCQDGEAVLDLQGGLDVSGVITSTSPVFTTPDLGTPSALVATNVTDIPAGAYIANSIDDDDISNTADVMSGSFGITIDGGGGEITTGIKGYIEIPYAMTIDRATVLLDQSGSIVIDVWLEQYVDYPPTDADTITSITPPTVTGATKSENTTLTNWTTSVAAGDIIGFNVDSCTTATRAHLIISGNKL